MAGSNRQDEAQLCAAAAQNSAAVMQSLLKAGTDPNSLDQAGRPALQIAVGGGHAEAAACLLAYGARPDPTGSDGVSLFAPERTPVHTLHAIRQHYQRFQTYDEARRSVHPPKLQSLAAELTSRGILHLPGFVGPQALQRMQGDLGAFVREIDGMVARGEGIKRHYDEELHWCPKDNAYISNNAFKYSRDLVDFCFNAELLAIVDLFLGKPSFISRGVATRYPPADSTNKRAFSWHHDMEERRLKALVLLTDVGEADQHMSYVAGSHTLYHPYEMFLENSCTHDYCQERLGHVEVVHAIGRAGDVFLFDSNGAHRGIRRPNAAVRDAFFVEFATSISQVWGGDLDGPYIESLAAAAGVNPFDRMLAARKKWTPPIVRSVSGWAETLPQLHTWL
ncbi:MAG: phytanoyl-CoA dioxygenase family protein [Acidobacteriota bacterium]